MKPGSLHPMHVREVDNGQYTLFGRECPTEVMAAYERLWTSNSNNQRNGDILMAWVVTTTLLEGDTEFGETLIEAMRILGWVRPA